MAASLVTTAKRKVERPSLDIIPASSMHVAVQGTPTNDTRFDGVDHLPLHREKR